MSKVSKVILALAALAAIFLLLYPRYQLYFEGEPLAEVRQWIWTPTELDWTREILVTNTIFELAVVAIVAVVAFKLLEPGQGKSQG